MADRFHFNPKTGRTGKCAAQVQCRFGQSDDQHGATREEARANYENQMAPELFSNTEQRAQTAEVRPERTAAQLDEIANEYEQEHGISLQELLDHYEVDEAKINEADRSGGGRVWLKNDMEFSITTELARHELKKLRDAQFKHRRANYLPSMGRFGSRY